MDTPWRPFDDDDDRRLIEHGGIQEAKQPWDWEQPPQKTARAVRVHVLYTWLLLALATAYRLQRAHEATGGEPVGWRRWRRQLLEQTRDQVIGLAQGDDGSLPLAESSLLLGGKRQEVPPGIGTRQDILANDRLTMRRSPLCRNLRLEAEVLNQSPTS